jgi:predicted dehydrogenase
MSARKIRVGMIGCDLHALYYGVQMERHDPLVLRSLGRGQAAFFYHYLHYSDPTRLTSPFVPGFTIAKVWDPDPQAAEVASAAFGGTPQVCETFAECSDDVDLVFIPDCNGDGSGHLKLATPGLQERVPTFVDKPLANNLEEATAIVALAQRRRTPVLSLSMLRTVPHARHFRERLQEIAPVGFGSIKGPGQTLAGSIHTISLAQHVFGAGVQAVDCMGPSELAYVHLDYDGRPDRPTAGVMLNCDSGPTYHCSLYVSAFSEKGAIHSGQIGDFEFPWGAAEILRLIKRMVRSGRAPFPYEEMLECLAIADAGRLAQRVGRRVALRETGWDCT